MKRPVLWLVLFLISGICMGRYLSIGEYRVFMSAIFLFLCLGLCWHWKQFSPVLFFAFFLIGVFSTEHALYSFNIDLEKAAEEEKTIQLVGMVTDSSMTSTNRQKLTVVCRSIAWDNGESQDDIKISVLLPEGENEQLWNVIFVKGKLQKFHNKSVPGGFDEWMYMKTRGFSYQMFPEKTKKLFYEPPVIREKVSAFRDKVNTIYSQVFDERESGIVKAMLTGEKDDIDEVTRELFSKAGITHLLAISGIHITIIGLYLFFILHTLSNLNRRISSAVVIIFLLAYLAFIGFYPAAVRAVIIACVGLFGHIIFRSDDKINSIALAAVIILLIQPLYLWDIGFQCSFIMAACLVGIWDVLNQSKNRYSPNATGILFTVAATLCSYGITAYYFHSISLSAVLVNLIALPMSGILIGLSILIAITGFVSMSAATFLAGTVTLILKIYQWICSFAVSVFGENICFTPSCLTVFLFYGALLGIYLWKRESMKSRVFFIAMTILFVFSLVSNRLIFHQDIVAFLDVGQGDSTVYITYDKKAFVFDTGGKWNAERGHNTGARIVQPYLEYQGISEIDGLFLSHMDSDHCEGALELMEEMPVKALYLSEYDFEPSVLYASVLEVAQRKNILLYRVKAGDKAELSEGVTIECLYPPSGIRMIEENDNHGSMVLKLEHNGISFLLTGDADKNDETWIAENTAQKKTDFLKAGHHGSKTSTSALLLETFQPKTVVVSCGANNNYGHPNQDTIERIESTGAEIFRTDQDGTITVTLNKKGYQIHTMKGTREDEGIKKAN